MFLESSMIQYKRDSPYAEFGLFFNPFVDISFRHCIGEAAKLFAYLLIEFVNLIVAYNCAFAAIFVAKFCHTFLF